MQNKITIPEPVKQYLIKLFSAFLLIAFSYHIIFMLKAIGTETIANTIKLVLDQISPTNYFQMIGMSIILSLAFIVLNSILNLIKLYFHILSSPNNPK